MLRDKPGERAKAALNSRFPWWLRPHGDTPAYNPHAHIFINRLDERGRVIKLGRSALSKVQDMTAEVMEMERGEYVQQDAPRAAVVLEYLRPQPECSPGLEP